MSRVFLTGATGYVGSVVAQKLQEAGHQVVGLARNDTAVAKLQERNIEPYRGDLSEPENLTPMAREVDGVIHTAFNHDFSNFAAAVQIERNFVTAFANALEGSGKPLITSQGTAYLGDTGDSLADEKTPSDTDPDFSVFSVRAKAEQDALHTSQRGVRSVALRLPHFVYGRAGSVFVPFLLQAARETGVARYVGAGKNKFSAVHVDDAALLYVLALERAPAGSIFHASAASGFTSKAIAEAIARNLGCKTESISMEDARSIWGEVMALFVSMNSQLNGNKAMEELNWKPKTNLSLLEDIEHGSYQ